MARKNIRSEVEKNNLDAASKKIAVKIIKRLWELGMTQKDFASMMGVNQSEACRWTGGQCNFTILTLTKIEQKLQIKLIAYE